MKTVGQIQTLFQDGDQHLGADGYPYLRLDGVLGCANKCLDLQMLRQIGIDLPRSCRVRIGQRVAGYCLAAKAQVIQPSSLGSKVDLDIAKRLSIRQLRKRHGEKLIQTREVLDLVIASVRCDAAPKGSQRQMCHDLREHQRALVHGGSLRKTAKKLPVCSDSKFKSRPEKNTEFSR